MSPSTFRAISVALTTLERFSVSVDGSFAFEVKASVVLEADPSNIGVKVRSDPRVQARILIPLMAFWPSYSILVDGKVPFILAGRVSIIDGSTAITLNVFAPLSRNHKSCPTNVSKVSFVLTKSDVFNVNVL